MNSSKGINRQIFALALPALGAEAAQPLFVLCDSAIVGHLGATALGGLSVAGAITNAVVGLMIFLAYATTPAVAKHLGAGHAAAAISAGWTGIWLAAGTGGMLTIVGESLVPWITTALAGNAAVAAAATSYLRISLLGLTPQLIALAATGLLRGLQNTTTPLVVASVGFSLNAALNWVLVYPAGWGLAGSAWGTVWTQTGLALVYLGIALQLARKHTAALRPHRSAITGLAQNGGWLMIRTMTLQLALLLTVRLAAAAGPEVLAGYQAVTALFGVLQYALDALGVAGQALVGRERGAGSLELDRLRHRVAQWGVIFGCAEMAIVLAICPWIGPLFTTDAHLLTALPPALAVLSLTLPLTGWVFAMDGVLIGAEDFRYLAKAGLGNLGLFLPVWGLLFVPLSSGTLPTWISLVLSWAAFGCWFSLARLLTLGLRLRSTEWMHLPQSAAVQKTAR